MKSAAEIVIERFGGVRPLARRIGRHPSSVARWPLPSGKETRGLDGRVPGNLQEKLLEAARADGIKLTAEELVSGEQAGG